MDKALEEGEEVVVVMGVGFVRAIMAKIIADTKDENSNYSKFVIGCQKPSTSSFKVNELVDYIYEILEKEIKAVYIDPRLGDIIHFLVDISRAKGFGHNDW